jgi:ABC-type polysaccharide/polyol phosphate transport system ATPase subunit
VQLATTFVDFIQPWKSQEVAPTSRPPKDASFSVQRGQTLGLIGGNGSGQSRLLRLLAGIYPPDGGKITIYGRVGTMMEL